MRLIVSVLAVAAGLFYMGYLVSGGQREPPSATTLAVGESTGQRIHIEESRTERDGPAVANTERSVTAARAVVFLPAPGTPLVDVFDELAERAVHGDARAACRLGVELLRCRRQPQQHGFLETLQGSVAISEEKTPSEPAPAPTAIDPVAGMRRFAEAGQQVCGGLTPDQIARAAEFQRIAAERGNARMRLWYVADPALDSEFFLDDMEAWQHYRTRAAAYLEQALSAGEPDAPGVLARVHHPRDGFPVVPSIPLRRPDPFRHAVFSELAKTLGGPTMPGLAPDAVAQVLGLQTTTPDDLDMVEVQAEVERLRQAHYADLTPAQSQSIFADPLTGVDPERLCGS